MVLLTGVAGRHTRRASKLQYIGACITLIFYDISHSKICINYASQVVLTVQCMHCKISQYLNILAQRRNVTLQVEALR